LKADIRVALVGNPNTGKSTLFNALTGLNQKIGNFPGVTVDKKIGYSQLPDGRRAEIVLTFRELIVYTLKAGRIYRILGTGGESYRAYARPGSSYT
jgi:ribosome-binding ATPase YchF (GTP1/OBG family)